MPRILLLVGALIAVGTAGILGFLGSTNPNPLPISDFVIFAQDSITLGSDNTVSSGNLGANKRITSGSKNNISGNLFSKRILVGPSSTISGNVQTDKITLANGAEILGETQQPLLKPIVSDFPTVSLITPGNQNINVKPSETLTLQPGDYKNITVGPNSTLNLPGGTYNIDRLTINPNTTINIQATITLNVKSHLSTGDDVVFSLAPSLKIEDVKINSIAQNINLGSSNIFTGLIVAPEATVNIGANTILRGQVVAKKITIGKGVILSKEEEFEKESDPEKVVEDEGVKFIVNEVIVLFEDEATVADAQAVAALVNGRITGFVPEPQIYKFELETDTIEDMKNAIQTIKDSNNPLIVDVVRNLLAQ